MNDADKLAIYEAALRRIAAEECECRMEDGCNCGSRKCDQAADALKAAASDGPVFLNIATTHRSAGVPTSILD